MPRRPIPETKTLARIRNSLGTVSSRRGAFTSEENNREIMSDEKVKIGLIQMSCDEDPQKNREKIVGKIREAAEKGAQIICTQELFTSKYFCLTEDVDKFDLAEPIPGPSTGMLTPLAKELGVVIVASLFEKRDAGLYHNTAVVIDADGEIVGKYRKMHIPDDPGYYEKFYFTPGDLGFRAWDTRFGRIGVCICWDQWFPESARLTALDGAKLIFFPTAIGWHDHEKDTELGPTQHDAWEGVQRGHAIANGVYVAAPNRVGKEGSSNFWGQSFIFDPFGRLVHRASTDKEELIVQEIDLGEVDRQRRGWPFLRDRRVDAYGDLLKLHRR